MSTYSHSIAAAADGFAASRTIVPALLARTAECLHLLPTFKSIAPWSRATPKDGRSAAVIPSPSRWHDGAPGIALEIKFEELAALADE